MQPEYLERLPDDLQQLVLDTEQAIGFAIEVVVAPERAKRRAGEIDPMACEVELGFARMLVSAPEQFRPSSAFHELLHVRRFLVEGAPKLVDCSDYADWTPAIGTALTMHDNSFEHLIIVPQELQRFPGNREHWEAMMVRNFDDIVAGRGGEVASKQLGLACWAFLRRVLPDSPALPGARAVLEASGDLEHAERFCEALFPVLEDKEAAMQAWFDYQGVPLELASLKYFAPLEYRTWAVPLAGPHRPA
jgi:hypothetical protein